MLLLMIVFYHTMILTKKTNYFSSTEFISVKTYSHPEPITSVPDQLIKNS